MDITRNPEKYFDKTLVVVGIQWGDEGKGKLIDWLTQYAQGVVRFQGGHNAGHTLKIGTKIFKLNLIPSGIVRPNILCYIGNGVVLDGAHLAKELAHLQNDVPDAAQRIHISLACPLILPSHRALDHAREKKRGKAAIGTTNKGIGPAYEDKVARRTLRVGDLLNPDQIHQKVEELLEYHNFLLKHYFSEGTIPLDETLSSIHEYRDTLLSLAKDVSSQLASGLSKGDKILFEGAQGSLLDVDHGSYPYVTSSNCIAGQASTGSGVGVGHFHYVLGIVKAYTTRVGAGPFPTELNITLPQTPGEQMSRVGVEFGTVTGRPRRCGWLDIPALRRAVQINGVTHLCITKLDVLDGLDKLQICTHYRNHDGKNLDIAPSGAQFMEGCQPVYETIAGWKQPTVGKTNLEQLPKEAHAYLKRIETLLGIPIALVSTGAERQETINLNILPFCQ